MSGDSNSNQLGRRRIRLETQFGSARESRSRKNRPCDVCRNRKTACVIAVEPPCRLCTSRGLQCTFTSKPKPKTRSNPQPIRPKAIDKRGTRDHFPLEHSPDNSKEDNVSHLSPQESRFPVTSRRIQKDAVQNANPLHQLAATASQLTASTLDSQHPIKSGSHISNRDYDRNRRVSLLLNDVTEHSLEDSKDFKAHFIGLSGEQDTNLLATIRYNVLNETNFVDFNVRQVYPGDPVRGTPPIHFSILQDALSDRDQRTKSLASDAIESHVGEVGDVLLKLYFRFVHPILPVLSKSRILKSYVTDKLSIPASLRGAIYGLASAFLTEDMTLEDVPPITPAVLFEHAHAALNRELDSPKLSTLQACLLVMHQQPEMNGTTESPRIWVLACQATACAQSLGLHRDPSSWKMPSWEIKLRKKLWWVTYITDKWTSVCHGNTPHIPDDSFDTSDLDVDDLSFDEDVTGVPGCDILDEGDRTFERHHAVRFLLSLRLTKLLGEALRHGFTLQSYSETLRKPHSSVRENSLLKLGSQLEEWLSLVPRSLAGGCTHSHRMLHLGCSLHLAFFAAKFLVLRALMSPATSVAKSDASSRLRQHFNVALNAGEQFMDFFTKVGKTELYTFWPRQSRTNLIISGNFLTYLFFCASTEELVAKTYNMLESYRDLLRSLAKSADWTTIGLLRPSLLRTESFFHGAAEGIRLSGQKK